MQQLTGLDIKLCPLGKCLKCFTCPIAKLTHPKWKPYNLVQCRKKYQGVTCRDVTIHSTRQFGEFYHVSVLFECSLYNVMNDHTEQFRDLILNHGEGTAALGQIKSPKSTKQAGEAD